MSRKHFEALAKALRECKPTDVDMSALESWRKAVQAVADVCDRSNVLFNRSRFVAACGLTGA